MVLSSIKTVRRLQQRHLRCYLSPGAHSHRCDWLWISCAGSRWTHPRSNTSPEGRSPARLCGRERAARSPLPYALPLPRWRAWPTSGTTVSPLRSWFDRVRLCQPWILLCETEIDHNTDWDVNHQNGNGKTLVTDGCAFIRDIPCVSSVLVRSTVLTALRWRNSTFWDELQRWWRSKKGRRAEQRWREGKRGRWSSPWSLWKRNWHVVCLQVQGQKEGEGEKRGLFVCLVQTVWGEYRKVLQRVVTWLDRGCHSHRLNSHSCDRTQSTVKPSK